MRLADSQTWDLPGGRMDEGESWMEGLRREVKEEAGVDEFDIVKILEVANWIHRGDSHYGIFFLGETQKGNVSLSEEHDKFLWIKTVEDMEDLKFAHSRLRELVEEHIY